MIFETERLYVRLLNWDDFEAFHEMQSQETVMRYTTGKAMTKEENEEDLKKVISAYEKVDNDFWVWAIVRKIDGLFVGTCAIVKTDDGEWEIGYRLIPKFWGKGYGFEITESLLVYGVEEMNIPELVAYVDRENVPSVRILEKSSMVFVKEFYHEEYQSWDRKYVYSSIG